MLRSLRFAAARLRCCSMRCRAAACRLSHAAPVSRDTSRRCKRAFQMARRVVVPPPERALNTHATIRFTAGQARPLSLWGDTAVGEGGGRERCVLPAARRYAATGLGSTRAAVASSAAPVVAVCSAGNTHPGERCTTPSLIPTVYGNTVRSFSTHGHQSAAQGSLTTVSRSDIRLIQHLDSSAHGLVRRWRLIGKFPYPLLTRGHEVLSITAERLSHLWVQRRAHRRRAAAAAAAAGLIVPEQVVVEHTHTIVTSASASASASSAHAPPRPPGHRPHGS
jgi:hypothetical protein